MREVPAKSVEPQSARREPIADGTTSAEELPRRLGRYVLLRLLVRGGMGEVYLASSIGIEGAERPLVVKRIRREFKTDPSFVARFLDEARVQAQLDDPGIARIVEADLDERGDPYVAVEFVEGRSLAEVRTRIQKSTTPASDQEHPVAKGELREQFGSLTIDGQSSAKAMGWGDAVAITLEMASALAHVHERTGSSGAPLGIVHRDLSPQNVMVGFSGDVKLIDFGTARGDNRRCHTVSGSVLAKPGYCAPEVARGDAATPRADLYALGVMLWELVAGMRYLDGEVSEHITAILNGTLRPAKLAGLVSNHGAEPSSDGPIPAEFDRIVEWLTEPTASKRCPSAREAAQALAGLLGQSAKKPAGEQSVRARVKRLLSMLYPNEPSISRSEFSRLIARARRILPAAELTGATRDSREPQPILALDATDTLPGTRYRLLRRIGEGAMGTVYEGEHLDLGRRVAIKVLQAKHSSSREYVARFRREARAIASVSHPNLVQVYDFGQTPGEARTPKIGAKDGHSAAEREEDWSGRLFFAMELLEGEPLDVYLSRERGMDFRDACEIGIRTCKALQAAHEKGLVHRDLKAANLFLTYLPHGGERPKSASEFGVKLLDFGVTKGCEEDANKAGEGQISVAGAIFGTPETMAPEQVAGRHVDARADLYALGCVLYELLTGRQVFDATSSILLMSAHVSEQPKSLRAVAPNRAIPEAVERVVLRALQKKPDDRFIDANAMREALEDACYQGFFEERNKSTEMVTPVLARVAAARDSERDEIPVDIVFESPAPSKAHVDEQHTNSKNAPLLVTRLASLPSERTLSDRLDRDLALLGTLQQVESVLPPSVAKPSKGRTIRRAFGVLCTAVALGGAGFVISKGVTAYKHKQVTHVSSVTIDESPMILSATNADVPVPITPIDVSKSPIAMPIPRTTLLPSVELTSGSAPAKSSPAPTADVAKKVEAPSVAAAEKKLAGGDPEGALEMARLLREMPTNPGMTEGKDSHAVLRLWARAAYAARRFGEAHDAATAWANKVPRGPAGLEARLFDAKALHTLGRDDEARTRLTETVRSYPTSVEAKSMLRELESLKTPRGAAPGSHPGKSAPTRIGRTKTKVASTRDGK